MALTEIQKAFPPKAIKYTFFSSAHGIFSRIGYILAHKSNLSKFKKIEIVSSIFSNHNALRPDIDYKKKSVRNTNIWRLNNTFLNNQQVTEEIKREIKKFLETNDNENTTTRNLWDAAKAVPALLHIVFPADSQFHTLPWWNLRVCLSLRGDSIHLCLHTSHISLPAQPCPSPHFISLPWPSPLSFF